MTQPGGVRAEAATTCACILFLHVWLRVGPLPSGFKSPDSCPKDLPRDRFDQQSATCPLLFVMVLQAVIDTGKLAPFDILMPDEELAPEEVKQVSSMKLEREA